MDLGSLPAREGTTGDGEVRELGAGSELTNRQVGVAGLSGNGRGDAREERDEGGGKLHFV